MKTSYFLILTMLLSLSNVTANFQEEDIYSLYSQAQKDGKVTEQEIREIIYATQNPYSPTDSHTGSNFLEALAWYNDILLGDRDGWFSLEELSLAFEKQVKQYLAALFQEQSDTQRISAWKMVQKLEILRKVIVESGRDEYPYSEDMGQVSYDNEWNRKNTILSRVDFEKRVLDASWKRPVLIKFGLTYCVHCLLMENLGSVPAVAEKYEDEMDVYKLWWNPKDPAQYGELNQIAAEEGITSSPMFNLYINGKLVKSDYAFPDDEGEGLEEFLSDYL